MDEQTCPKCGGRQVSTFSAQDEPVFSCRSWTSNVPSMGFRQSDKCRISELQRKLEERQWISVEDGLPKVGKVVWMWNGRGPIPRPSVLDDEGQFRYCFDDGTITLGPYEGVTHWAHIMLAPNEGEGA